MRGDDAEVVQALACRAGLSEFESRRHLNNIPLTPIVLAEKGGDAGHGMGRQGKGFSALHPL